MGLAMQSRIDWNLNFCGKLMKIFIILSALILFPGYSWSFSSGFLEVATSRTVPGVSQYSDSFTESSDTSLTTHDSNWVTLTSAYTVSNFKVSGNLLSPIWGYADAGAYYSASTSNTCQVVFKAQSSAYSARYITVRAGTNNLGYAAQLAYAPGSTFQEYSFSKNGVEIKVGSLASNVTWGDDHTVKITASGTTEVILNLYVDGTLQATYTDSSDTITSGHPGIYCMTPSNQSATLFDDWQDH